jgi:hypothetical protein
MGITTKTTTVYINSVGRVFETWAEAASSERYDLKRKLGRLLHPAIVDGVRGSGFELELRKADGIVDEVVESVEDALAANAEDAIKILDAIRAIDVSR